MQISRSIVNGLKK